MNSETLVSLVDELARLRGWSRATASTYACGSGDTISRLANGVRRRDGTIRAADITLGRAARITQWLSDHWPADAAWPTHIAERPAPSPGFPATTEAAAPPPPVDDPVETVTTLKSRIRDLMDVMARGEPVDWDAVKAMKIEMIRTAAHLGEDGRVASPIALCLALGVDREVYDKALQRYADGRPGRKPRRGGDYELVVDTLVEAGDARFARRRSGAATPPLPPRAEGIAT